MNESEQVTDWNEVKEVRQMSVGKKTGLWLIPFGVAEIFLINLYFGIFVVALGLVVFIFAKK